MYEETMWNEPTPTEKRALVRIYFMCITILSLMFCAMGLQLMLTPDGVVTQEDDMPFLQLSLGKEDELPVLVEDSTDANQQEPLLLADWQDDVVVDPYVYYNVPLSQDLQRYTQELCDSFAVAYPLVLAIMEQESRFQTQVVSEPNSNGSSDFGIMQINSGNHLWLEAVLGVDDWLDPYQNILAGVYILSLYGNFGDDLQAMAMCYNLGPSQGKENVQKQVYTVYSEEVMARLSRFVEIEEL